MRKSEKILAFEEIRSTIWRLEFDVMRFSLFGEKPDIVKLQNILSELEDSNNDLKKLVCELIDDDNCYFEVCREIFTKHLEMWNDEYNMIANGGVSEEIEDVLRRMIDTHSKAEILSPMYMGNVTNSITRTNEEAIFKWLRQLLYKRYPNEPTVTAAPTDTPQQERPTAQEPQQSDTESQQERPTADGLQLPSSLNSDRARKYFPMAISKGWMKQTESGCKWLFGEPRGGEAQDQENEEVTPSSSEQGGPRVAFVLLSSLSSCYFFPL